MGCLALESVIDAFPPPTKHTGIESPEALITVECLSSSSRPKTADCRGRWDWLIDRCIIVSQ